MLEDEQEKLREENSTLKIECRELVEQLENTQSDSKDWIAKAEVNMSVIKELDTKLSQVTAEKRDFELLLTRY